MINNWIRRRIGRMFEKPEPAVEVSDVDDDGNREEMGEVGFNYFEEEFEYPAPDKPDEPFVPPPNVETQAGSRSKKIVEPARELTRLAFEASISLEGRRQLAGKHTQIVVVMVPSPQWYGPMKQYLQSLWRGDVRVAEARGRASSDNIDVSGLGATGRRFTFVSSDARHVPSTISIAADLTLLIKSPVQATIRRLVNRVGRGKLGPDVNILYDGLDFDDLIAIIRSGRPVADICQALARATAMRINPPTANDAPDLRTSLSFGAARAWGLALAEDIDGVRRGEITWNDVDRGAVIFGPPGTGKTLFAKSLAKCCNLPIVITSIGELFASSSGDLGAIIKAQRQIFDRAKATAPSILFLDELDALPNRETLTERGRDWWLPVITDFLILLDSSVSDRNGVVVVGATNHIEHVDPAVLRPGRLERGILLGLPDQAGIEGIFRHHLREDLAEGDLSTIAADAIGATPAEIMEWVRSARRRARRAGRALIADDLATAMTGGVSFEKDVLRRMAVHEAGHAVLATILGYDVLSVSVSLRGRSGGRSVVSFKNLFVETEQDIKNEVIYLLAGRAAEDFIIGNPSSGAGGSEGSDLHRATQLLARMNTSFGLGKDLLHLSAPNDALGKLYLPEVRANVSSDLRILYRKALDLIAKHRDAVSSVAERLLETPVLSGEDVRSIVALSAIAQ